MLSFSVPSSQFMADHTQSDIELVHSALRPLLMMLGDYRNLTPTLLQRLTHMISLFPTSFNEKMCDSLMVMLLCVVSKLHVHLVCVHTCTYMFVLSVNCIMCCHAKEEEGLATCVMY